MPYINLHSHSYHSDGFNSVFEMAVQAKRLGHCAYVLTDHDYCDHAYRKGRQDLIVSDLAEIPIIVGLEVSVPIGECLMFGKDNIEEWIKYKRTLKGFGDTKRNTIESEILNLFSRKTCPLIVCHPGQFCRDNGYHVSMYRNTLELVIGYEETNHESTYPETVRKNLEEFTGRKMKTFHNSDAHAIEQMSLACNKIEKEITTEDELIEAILDPEFQFTIQK